MRLRLLAPVLLTASISLADELPPKLFSWPPAPRTQDVAAMSAKTAGCMSCHTATDSETMHDNPAVRLGCVDCHGGDATVFVAPGTQPTASEYQQAKHAAHVEPRFPDAWPSAANPVRSYTLLNREAPDFVRFVNPGDLRVARVACGACHLETVAAVERSLMATGAMLFGGASYNNGILPNKRYILGEAYTAEGRPARLDAPIVPTAAMEQAGIRPWLLPLPAWETVPPGDNFRVFERGGRDNPSRFPDLGLPNPSARAGRPDILASNRGPGTGLRVAIPVLNITKTRLNDPLLWFLGTGDHPGDHRSSGCTACHVVYANDRAWHSSGSYSRYGHDGKTVTVDPTLRPNPEKEDAGESGHPLRHQFTRAIPTSQCMTCHLHQPNMFLNSYLGYTMWDYESDAELMWPEKQRNPSASAQHQSLEHNPEEAATRGLWTDPEFLSRVWDDINPRAKHTQFADYHSHGWNFRAVFKRARDGSLLDAKGATVDDDLDPKEKWQRAVHMRDIHAERGMQCADCHFAQDAHGDGNIYAEVAAAVEIRCQDCHGTTDAYSTLRTSGPAAPAGGTDLERLRNMDGRRRFVRRGDRLYQRLILEPHVEHRVTQLKDIVDPARPEYNPRAARAKTLTRGPEPKWGAAAADCATEDGARCARAHDPSEMSCFACHSSWVTSCAGCHLSFQANWKTERHHYEGGSTRGFASYNPQAARDQMFQLGRHGDVKNGIITPVRSSSALVLSSVDARRNKLYVQQPPVSSAGFSSQAFAPHFPHTVRTTETKSCDDCHVSRDNDNNAILAQLLLQGTGFVNFLGYHAWVGTDAAVEAIQVTEWDEPQAVIGSYLQRMAYPDNARQHLRRERELTTGHRHGAGAVGCLQLRGEYLYTAEGTRGMRVYDVATIGHKDTSQKIRTAPVSPLGQRTAVDSADATCVVLPTNQPIRPERNRSSEQRAVNREQAIHPIYSYAAVTDRTEGLILVEIETLGDGEPRNNHLERAVTWNPDGALDGAVHAQFAGHLLYVSTARGIAVVDLDRPLAPRLAAMVPMPGVRATAVQFRYLFALDASGLRVVDVTFPRRPRLLADATVRLDDARRLYLARTYAYIAGGSDGLVIVDIERPEQPRLEMKYTADGSIDDARDVVVATTNASLFAYVAGGRHGLQVVQLTSPESQPRFYGFSPAPRPLLIAHRPTRKPARALSRGLERDRAVDETGHQIAVFGRVGSRPFTLEEMQRFYLDADGEVYEVDNHGRADEPPTSSAPVSPPSPPSPR